MRNLFLLLGLVSVILFSSCSNDHDDLVVTTNEISELNTEQYLTNFASILSKATYDRKDVREFLKNESAKQFDKNYDVLYYLVKDEKIGGETFREILASYSSIETLYEIEVNVPLLNILVPEIPFFDIRAENMPLDDQEIPVALSKTTTTSLFLNGEEEVSLEKGEIPNFHVFVVNENSRVIVPSNQKNGLRSTGAKTIQFKSPNYDGSKVETSLRSTTVDESIPGAKAIEAFKYFNKDDGSIAQKAFQRDHIYYGITPQNPSGSLNRSVSEYLSFIEIDPKIYFKIADQKGTDSTNDDPTCDSEKTVSQKHRKLTEDQLLDKFWTKGAYDFRFEIIMSTSEEPQIIYIPLKPNEIWDFNYDYTYRSSTFFRSSKHTYRIDPNKFTSKRVDLSKDKISLGKWNLAEESIYRYVIISEEDEGIKTTTKREYETVHILASKFKGDVKFEVGLGDSEKMTGGAEYEVSESNTKKDNKTVTIERSEKSDNLGNVRIYFYDPIIESKANNSYYVHTYNTGCVRFAVTAQ